ncbi:Flotillin-2 [Trichinella spiralis]|uniref:Flotillin-2 n=1 Tax=Trichinella spiralis TaxID=6334 RepID=A0ABR3KCU2_TRISP
MAQEDAGIQAAERQRKTRKDKSIESWPPGASGQSQLINGAKQCAVTQRQDVLAVAIHRWLGVGKVEL